MDKYVRKITTIMNKYNDFTGEYEYASDYEAEYVPYEDEEYVPYEDEEYFPQGKNRTYEISLGNWDDDDFEAVIPKVTIPKFPKVLKPISTSFSIEIEVEAEPKPEPEPIPEKTEVDLTRFLNWNKTKQPTTPEKPEIDVDMTQFLNWGQTKLSLPEEKKETKQSLEFPSLEDSLNQPKPVQKKFNMGKARFTKLDLAKVEKECLDIVKKELEIISIVPDVPNLYLNKRKAREYCESVACGFSCYRDNCRMAHSLEDYLPLRCPLSSIACKEKNSGTVLKKNEDCKRKHDDETLEMFLFRIKLVDSSLFKKLNNVREKNKTAFKEERKIKTPEKVFYKPQKESYEYISSDRCFSTYLDALKCDLKNQTVEENQVEENQVEEAQVEEENWIVVEKKKKEEDKKSIRAKAIKTLSDVKKIEKALNKTKLCLNWRKNGKCPRGNQCGFAHGQEELKVATCIFGIKCKKADCKFAHPGESDRRSEAFDVLSNTEKIVQKLAKTKLCLHWQKNGKCPKGKDCGFAHGKEELQIAKCIFGEKCRKPECRFAH